jgi:hypothetical protein
MTAGKKFANRKGLNIFAPKSYFIHEKQRTCFEVY